jgi:hypothetical protein
MSFGQIRGDTSPSSHPQNTIQLMTRGEKTTDFMSNALPTAFLNGLQAFRQPTLSGSLGATTSATSSTAARAVTALGSAASIANITVGALGAWQLATNWGKSSPAAAASSGLAAGAAIGTAFAPGIGTAIGAGIGTLAGGLIGCITSGKHRDQKVRDVVRDMLVQSNILNSHFQLPLADGSLYDMGKDGGPRMELGGLRPYEIDFNNPLVHYAVAWINPLIELLSQGDEKVHADFVGYFANAAISNAKTLEDVRRNVDSFMARFGLTNQNLAQSVASLAQAGQIDRQTAQAYIQGISERANPNFQGSSAFPPLIDPQTQQQL